MRGLDLTGQTFARLTVRERVGTTKAGKVTWACDCVCGATIVTVGSGLRSSNTKSCGCLQRERAMAQVQSMIAQNTTHGSSRGPHAAEFMAWSNAIQRCTNPNSPGYRRYGGRGIVVAMEWRSDFLAFLGHIGKRPSPHHSLDRIDNDGNYEPGNVRWSIKAEQSRNTSTAVGPTTVQRVQEQLGKGRHPKVIARELGIHDRTVRLIRDGQHWTVRDGGGEVAA